jgi:hypothetical protein
MSVTVRELIERLEKYPSEHEVYLWGYGKLSMAIGIDEGDVRYVELYVEGEEPVT